MQDVGVAQWLVAGGDKRIILDATTGRNQYGCQAQPDEDLIALGSSTASVISTGAWQEISHIPPSSEPAWDVMRQQLRSLVGVADDVTVVFTASGTDAHHLVAQYVQTVSVQTLTTIVVAANETGSGVVAALHDNSDGAVLTTIALRHDDGMPRASTEIDADMIAAAEAALVKQHHVLINLIDVSKTGLIAPSTHSVAALCSQYPEHITVVVDASQLRLASATLQAYLDSNYVVVITGSKFVTGPCFCGAVLIPQRIAQNWQHYPVPASLQTVSYASDWPRNFDVSALPQQLGNHGLYLRWRAALYELRAFRALNTDDIQRFLSEFSVAIRTKLNSNPIFEILPVPILHRAQQAWDSEQTIFSFVLYHHRQPLTRMQTLAIYQQLSSTTSLGPRFQLGQPVCCGSRTGVEVSALRISASVRLVVAALSPNGIGRDGVIASALAALDKVASLVNNT